MHVMVAYVLGAKYQIGGDIKDGKTKTVGYISTADTPRHMEWIGLTWRHGRR